jgi:hypothetical protein
MNSAVTDYNNNVLTTQSHASDAPLTTSPGRDTTPPVGVAAAVAAVLPDVMPPGSVACAGGGEGGRVAGGVERAEAME